MKNNKLFIGVIAMVILVAILINQDRPSKQAVADVECFEKDDCRVGIPEGFCSIEFDCIIGRCFSEPTLCPEVCGTMKDEDLDNLTDCKDPDCWNDPFCDCSKASFNQCVPGGCFCSGGIPRWHVTETDNWCACV